MNRNARMSLPGPWIRLGIVLVVCLGLARWEWISAALRTPMLWTAFLCGPGWVLGRERNFAASTLRRWGALLTISTAWNLGILALVSLLGWGLDTGTYFWCASLVIAALLGENGGALGWRRPRRAEALVLLLFLALFVHLDRQPPGLRLDSDMPAHLGAIHDAAEQDRWRPFDRSFPGAADDALDPRMGVLHGLHAAQARILGIEPLEEWGRSAAVLSLYFLVCFAWLFRELGLEDGWALAAAFLFASGAGGAAPLGIWAAVYPSQFALAALALSFGWMLTSVQPSEEGSSPPRWPGALLLGLSVLVHPFAWWGGGLVLVHLCLFLAARRRWALLKPVVGYGALALIVGLALVAPLLLRGAAEGPQWDPVGVMELSSGTFTIDPLVLIRWGGTLSLVAVGLALVVLRQRGGGLRSALVLAGTLPLWTVALDPLVQPAVFSRVGYLSERLGLLALAPAVLFLAVLPAPSSRFRRLRVLTGLVLGIALALSAFHGLLNSPYARESRRGQELVSRMRSLPQLTGPVLSDPRTSYLYRAQYGGPVSVLPIAHASPLDAGAAARLEAYRNLYTASEGGRLRRLLGETEARSILIPRELELLYPQGGEFGFVPWDEGQPLLVEHCLQAGAERLPSDAEWTVLSVAPQRIPDASASRRAAERIARERSGDCGIRLASLDLQPRVVRPGGIAEAHVVYEVDQITNWCIMTLRFLGPSPPIPNPWRPVGKLYRKLVVERSLRSPTRFAARWVLFDGYPPTGPSFAETRRIVIPDWILPGEYEVECWIEPAGWRAQRTISDYLRDDRLPAEDACRLRVLVETREP